MGKIFCVEFQRYSLKVHTKYLIHTLQDTIFILPCWKFTRCHIYEFVCVFETPPRTRLKTCWVPHDGVSNHQPNGCLLNRLFRHRSKKTPKLRVTGLCAGNSPVTGELPAKMASNAENNFIWWRHHVYHHNDSTIVSQEPHTFTHWSKMTAISQMAFSNQLSNFLEMKYFIFIQGSLKFVTNGNKPTLLQMSPAPEQLFECFASI